MRRHDERAGQHPARHPQRRKRREKADAARREATEDLRRYCEEADYEDRF